MFAVGVAQTVLVMVWWLVDLLGRYGGWYPPVAWSVPASWAHGYLMIDGIFPFFIFGFLMTAVPNWIGGRVERRFYVLAAVLMAAGLAVFYGGLVAGRGWLAAGVAIQLAGWLAGLLGLVRLMLASDSPKRRFAGVLIGVFLMGWLGAAFFLAGVLAESAALVAQSRRMGIWWFLFPVFFAVSHRMVPFFSSRALADYQVTPHRWPVPVMLAGAVAHGALETAGLSRWLWLADAPMFATALFLLWQWRWWRSLEVRLVAVLHLSLAGLAVALLLYTIQSLALALAGREVLGLAPLHALAIGYFAAMVVGMASRVSLGHSGRPLAADSLTWGAYLGVLAAALVRAAAELPGVARFGAISVLAGALWLACFGLWAYRYLPMYWRPRVDGKPG